MIRITRIETVYPAPADDEDDYCPDGDKYLGAQLPGTHDYVFVPVHPWSEE